MELAWLQAYCPRLFNLGKDMWFTIVLPTITINFLGSCLLSDVLVEHYIFWKIHISLAQFWLAISIVGEWCTQGVVWQREGNQWSQAGSFGLEESSERRKWSVCTTFQWSSKGVESFFYAAVRLKGFVTTLLSHSHTSTSNSHLQPPLLSLHCFGSQ